VVGCSTYGREVWLLFTDVYGMELILFENDYPAVLLEY
jgi:hypothetical protein